MEHLVILRIIGGVFSIAIVLWAFSRFRKHRIRRTEFLLMTFFGMGLLTVSIYPDSINILAGMLSMDNKHFGRLITLLILSNMLLWLLVFGLRNKDSNDSMQFDLLVRKLARDHFLREEGLTRIKEIMVILPALNEAENLDHILPGMPATVMGRPLGVLVIDDGSNDETIAIVRKHGFAVVSNPINRGGGAALRLGYDIAKAGGAKVIVTMDADGQHLPEEIERLVEPIFNNESDFVIGSRILGHYEKDSTIRWLGIHIFSFIINILAGTRITDCSSGFRAFRSDILQKAFLLQDQFHTAELIIDAARKGVRIIEIPITIKRRLSGKSKKGKNLNYGWAFFRTVLKTWWR